MPPITTPPPERNSRGSWPDGEPPLVRIIADRKAAAQNDTSETGNGSTPTGLAR